MRALALKVLVALIGFTVLAFVLPLDSWAWQITYFAAFTAAGIALIIRIRKNSVAPCPFCGVELYSAITASKRTGHILTSCPRCRGNIEV